MFYYYGGKSGLAHLYPAPMHDRIVEPFGGAGGYSCYWLSRRANIKATIFEKSPRIVELWQRVISEDYKIDCGPIGSYTTDPIVHTAAVSNASCTAVRWKITARIKREYQRQVVRLRRLRPILPRITVIQGDYQDAERLTACWFIDPPYMARSTNSKAARPGGAGYDRGCTNADVDYCKLAAWVRSRPGQVIACDYKTASWLPFSPLPGTKKDEGVWTNTDPAQTSFF